jgi:hypothetical protein
MPAALRWIVSTSASAFHAAEALARGQPLADAALAQALAEPAGYLAAVLADTGIPADVFWDHAAALAAGIHNNRELASVSLAKTIGRSPRQAGLIDPLAAAIAGLENAYNAFAPRSNDDLELRSGPLREQWEARGPGVLAQIGRATEPDLIVSQADVLLVHPALGGSGRAHLAYNSVRIEAVLANPHPALPEVVRLAWLIAQLNNDLPVHQGNLPRQRASEVAALALIPAALAAAEGVELARYDAAAMELALTAWQRGVQDSSRIVPTLMEWWDVYLESPPFWSVALAALDRMLPPDGHSPVPTQPDSGS